MYDKTFPNPDSSGRGIKIPLIKINGKRTKLENIIM